MPTRIRQREDYMKSLDSPEQATRAGGVNGKASIRGLPLRVEPSGKVGMKAAVRTGIVSEPVAVIMRDAVTVDTAVRFTGINRGTLQAAIAAGYLPAIRLGEGKSPLLVRMRDVITYLMKQGQVHSRRRRPLGETFLGFEEWFAEIVRENWQGSSDPDLGRYSAADLKPINRGGRPPGKRWATAEDMIATPQDDDSEIQEELPTDHALAQAAEDPPAPTLDRATLPKWHPLWVRPGAT